MTRLLRARLNPLAPWQRRTAVFSAASLFLSGLVWLPVHYWLGAGAGELPHPLEPWLMRWHGLSAAVGLFALGLVAAGHVSRGWGLGQRRASGLAVLLLAGTAAASGCALSYLVPGTWRPAVGLVHAALGTAMVGLGAFHKR